jgi:hypothetical protein
VTEQDRQTLRLMAQRLRWLADVLEHAEQGMPGAEKCLEEMFSPRIDAVTVSQAECDAVSHLYRFLLGV